MEEERLDLTETSDEISVIAEKYIRLNQRRKKLEAEEAELKKNLEQFFLRTGSCEVVTSKGTVKQQEVTSTEYDVNLLKANLHESSFQLISRLTVNSKAVEELLKDGKIDARIVDIAKKSTISKRIVIAPKKKARKVQKED